MTDTQTTTPAFDALKPCPFCGGEAVVKAPYGEELRKYVECQNNKCWMFGIMAKPEEWNARADQCIPASDIRPLVEALRKIKEKADSGIFPHLPVETVGAAMCIEIDKICDAALAQFQQRHPEVMK